MAHPTRFERVTFAFGGNGQHYPEMILYRYGRVSSIVGPCSGLSRRRSRVRARFSRVHLAQKWAPERTASGGFSFPPDDDDEFRGGRGKRVNRPPDSNPRRFTRGSFTLSGAARKAKSEYSQAHSKIEGLASSSDRGQALRTVGPIQRGDHASARY